MVVAQRAFIPYVTLPSIVLRLSSDMVRFTTGYGFVRGSSATNRSEQEHSRDGSANADSAAQSHDSEKPARSHVDSILKKAVNFNEEELESSAKLHAEKRNMRAASENDDSQAEKTKQNCKTSRDGRSKVDSPWDMKLPEIEWTEEDELV